MKVGFTDKGHLGVSFKIEDKNNSKSLSIGGTTNLKKEHTIGVQFRVLF
jgi:hypothetical protein